MGKRPKRTREIRVTACSVDHHARSAGLNAGGERVARQGSLGHEPVQMRVLLSEASVGLCDGVKCVVVCAGSLLRQVGPLGESVRDEGSFKRPLVWEMLVQRRRADANTLGDPPHRETLEAVLLEQLSCGGDDLAAAGGAGGVRRCSQLRSRRSTSLLRWASPCSSALSSVFCNEPRSTRATRPS